MGRLRDLLGSKRARGTLFAGSAVVIGLLIVVSIWEGPPTAEFDDPKDIDPVLLSHTSTRLVGYQKQEMVFGCSTSSPSSREVHTTSGSSV
jgi:hypothetical protein